MTGLLLGMDTATDALSVAVGDEQGIRAACWQRRKRGHAEALVPMLERVLRTAGAAVDDLSGIAVTVGPGTFTGVRIGLSAARGLRIAHPVPLVGLTTLEILACRAAQRWPDRPVLAALDARRDQVYAQYFRRAADPYREAWTSPMALSAEAAARMLVPGSVLTGSGAGLVAAHAGADAIHACDEQVPDAAVLVKMAARRGLPGGHPPSPDPLYLRAPDATPARPVLQR